MTEETIELAKHDADRFAPMAAEAEAEYRNLMREDKIIYSKCILRHKEEASNVEVLKALALTDPDYIDHVAKVSAAQAKHLKANKAFEALTEWLRLATSWNYKEQARFKAGV